MNYVISDKETGGMIDLLDLSLKDKLNYEKEHPNHDLTEATEEELVLYTDLDEFDDDDENWEDQDC